MLLYIQREGNKPEGKEDKKMDKEMLMEIIECNLSLIKNIANDIDKVKDSPAAVKALMDKVEAYQNEINKAMSMMAK